MAERNIVLAGFMGTGKTVVGRAVARRLGRPFLDMDDILVQRLGAPIAQVFARHGEAHFREAERALCRELSTPGGLVVAAGGGTVVDVQNRLALGRGGLLFCLTCSPQECLRRIGSVASRPMLHARDPVERMTQLMAERAPAYSAIPRRIDTSHLSIEAVADRVIVAYERDRLGETLTVNHGDGAYHIIYRDGALATIGEAVAALGLRGRVAVVTNSTVGPLHAAMVVASLEQAGLRPLVVEMPDGERFKTLDTVAGLYDRLAEARLERSEAVLALGGGVVGDVAGFLAATYLRGVAFIQAPTTVLSMVDSSVGGKVGVDHRLGKNLIGAFKQPVLVVADPYVLLSLPAEEARSGLAEVVKHGVIGDPELFAELEQHGTANLAGIIPQAIQVKIAVVQEDPFERGRRMVLNLGHTFGHALETLSQYRLRHGEAVSMGLVAAALLAQRLGICEPTLPGRLESVLRVLGLPVRHPAYDPQEIWEVMASDKKRKAGNLRFILPVRPGEVIVSDQVPKELVLEVLAASAESSVEEKACTRS